MSNIEDRRLFNLDILTLRPEVVRLMKPVTKGQIFESNSSNFDLGGLFSTEIFGPIGSELRNSKFGYIKLNASILHPHVFDILCGLKSYYLSIANGSKYAIFDKEKKDFILTSKEDGGQTGFDFFMKNVTKIEFGDTESNQRDFRIKFVSKYTADNYHIKEWLVLPAGLRDYTVDKSGKPSEDEINDLYRELLNTSNSLAYMDVDEDNLFLLDPIRYKIQNITLKIYNYIKVLLDGKSKFILGKVAKRSIDYGTRNIMTPLLTNIVDLDSTNKIGCNHTMVGLYQFSKAIAPITMYHMQNKFLNKIFSPETNKVWLINPETLETELTTIDIKKRDMWLTQEGLDNILNKLGLEDLRKEPIKVDGKYLCLLYDTGDNIEVVFDTRSLGPEYDKKYLRPITYTELVFISIHEIKDKYPGFLTRYPVAGLGGIYPTKPFLKTTLKSRKIKINLDGMYEDMLDYPDLTSEFVTALSAHFTHVARLDLDYDGDMCTLTILYEEESIKEIEELLKDKTYYITSDGKMTYTASTGTIDLVLKHMTRE